MGSEIDSGKITNSLLEIQKRLEDLKFRCVSDPGNAEEILSDALGQLQAIFEELSAADEEIIQQNEELTAAQEALMRTNERLDLAKRAAGAGIWDWDLTTNQIEWSPELFDLFGIDRLKSHASFAAWNLILHPEDREIANSRIELALREHSALDSVYRIIRPDGQTRWINALGQGVYDDRGRPVRMIGICIDITERMMAEERLRTTLESIGDGFFACDANWRFVYVNAPAERILGIRRDEVLGKSHWEVFPMTVNTNLEREYRRAAAGDIRDFENFYEPWGRWFHNRCYPREGGGMSVYFKDITERKMVETSLQNAKEELEVAAEELRLQNDELMKAQAALLVGEQRFRLALRNVPVSVSAQDSDLRFIWAYIQRTSQPEEIIGKFDSDIFTPEEAAYLTAIKRRVLDENVEVREQMWLDRPTGRKFLDVFFEPIHDEAGRTIGVGTATVDLTPMKIAEESLRETKKYLESLINYANAPIIVWDTSFKITRFNHAFERLTCLRAEEALGKPLDILFPESSKHESLSHIKRTLSGERWEIVEIPILRTDGSIRTVLWNSANIYADDGATVVATIAQGQDITERKQAEEQLHRAKDELEQKVRERTSDLSQAKEELEATNEELQVELEQHRKLEAELIKARDAAEEAAKVKAAFMANMSHELRTPMNSVIGFTGLLLDEKLTDEQREYVESIRNSGEALMVLINEVLDFSKMEREKMDLELQAFDMRNIVEEALDMVAAQAANKGLELSYAFYKNVPEAIIGDPGKLRQVLGNLLSNAVKFTKEGEVEVFVSSDPEQDEIHFAVRDTGIGIPEEEMGKLFQPFGQLDLSFSRGFEGTGLGLAISRKLVELMGGKIWLESEVGIGSTFHFAIPAGIAPAEHKPFLTGSFNGRRVLIVEENQTLRRILGRQVHAWSMMPMIASSIYEAAALLQRDSGFDAVIIDVSKGEVVSAISEKQDHWRQMPLIALAVLGRKVPANLFQAVLTKPPKPAKLFRALQEVLEKKGALKSPDTPENEKSNMPMRILLAEDNISNQKVTLNILRNLGYRADAVVNGREVLEALERQPYDIIFMDVKMPVMTGIEAARKIRERWPDSGPKIIAVTAYALHGDRERCLEAGMDGYIAKPVQKEDLLEALCKYRPPNEGP